MKTSDTIYYMDGYHKHDVELEKEMATHFSILAWRILWTEEPGWAYNPWAPKELDTTLTYARARQC